MTRRPRRSDIEAARRRIGAAGASYSGHRPRRAARRRRTRRPEARAAAAQRRLQGARCAELGPVATMPSTTGVCAASGGNHAGGVAWAARRAGVTADLFVPQHATPAKIARIEEYGGRIHLVDGFVKHALEECAGSPNAPGCRSSTPMTPSRPWQVPAPWVSSSPSRCPRPPWSCSAAVAAGSTPVRRPPLASTATRVQPVEPEMCPCLAEALAAGGPVDVAVGGVASDALGASRVGDIAYAVAAENTSHPCWSPKQTSRSAPAALEQGAGARRAGRLRGAGRGRDRPGERAGSETVVVVVSGGNNETLP